MKIRITLNDPDGIELSIQEALNNSIGGLRGLGQREMQSVADLRIEEIGEAVSKWVAP